MCQAIVYINKDGEKTELMRDVTLLEYTDEGLLIKTLFGEPKTVKASIKRIDLMKNAITIEPEGEA